MMAADAVDSRSDVLMILLPRILLTGYCRARPPASPLYMHSPENSPCTSACDCKGFLRRLPLAGSPYQMRHLVDARAKTLGAFPA